MSTPYVGEIRLFCGNFAPVGWELCHGQLLQISEDETLFQLIGTTYGGDGETTFAVPDLRGRVPVHQGAAVGGATRVIGEAGGTESVTLTVQQIPNHTHAQLVSSTAAGSRSPVGGVPAALASEVAYAAVDATEDLGATSVAGAAAPHENRQPYLAINYIISRFGVFPSQA